jgi:hypothetical protein
MQFRNSSNGVLSSTAMNWKSESFDLCTCAYPTFYSVLMADCSILFPVICNSILSFRMLRERPSTLPWRQRLNTDITCADSADLPRFADYTALYTNGLLSKVRLVVTSSAETRFPASSIACIVSTRPSLRPFLKLFSSFQRQTQQYHTVTDSVSHHPYTRDGLVVIEVLIVVSHHLRAGFPWPYGSVWPRGCRMQRSRTLIWRSPWQGYSVPFTILSAWQEEWTHKDSKLRALKPFVHGWRFPSGHLEEVSLLSHGSKSATLFRHTRNFCAAIRTHLFTLCSPFSLVHILTDCQC